MRLPHRVSLILSGRYEFSGFEPQEYDTGDLVQLARWVHDKCGRPRLCPPPLHLCRRMGVSVLDRVPLGAPNEYCDGDEVRYRWDPDPRVCGTRIVHGLGHCILVRVGWTDHTEADAWILGSELALPSEVAPRVRGLAHAARLQPHVELWLLMAQRAGVMARRLYEACG